jgi:YesN/AraC family two-component response regulator
MFTPDFIDKACLEGDDFSHLSDSFMFYSLFPNDKEFKERFNLVPSCNFEFETVFEKIYNEYKNRKIGYINLIRVYVAEIIIKLLRKIENQKKSSISESQKQIVERVIEYIENNYSIKINTEEIASKMFFNKNYISKLFKSEKGLSIAEFVREIRLKEACRLIGTTSRNISEIACECGFNDMKTFYLAFKKYVGVTPKAYRDSLAKRSIK